MATREQIEARPAYRVGEILETTPGLIVTQHSGEGKANQYFLRGFNLDHGTDISINVDEMPVNMRTHGHGQGYSDINFVIPELAKDLSFRKGPYFSDEGDFSSAGAVHLGYVNSLDHGFAQIEAGSFGYRRMVTAESGALGAGTMLAAAEYQHLDGPWQNPDDAQKLNGVLRYSQGSADNGFSITGMAYSAHWNSTDQVAQRAIDEGLIDRFGTLDPSDGGISQRFSLSANWSRKDADGQAKVSAYAIKSDLNLFNNFTYFLRDPVNGDQFEQADHRAIFGGKASYTFFGTAFNGRKAETEIGVETRYDTIDVGLFNTKDRIRLSTVREDHVNEASIGVFTQNTMRWTDWFRTTAGLRADYFSGDVDSNLAVNSGTAGQAIASPKLGLVFGPWYKTEFYLNGGFGYHSNDLRGVTVTVDPNDQLTKLTKSPLLVRSKGSEVGVRTEMIPGLISTASVFVLDFDSEIVFAGDAGTTEVSRPSRRIGAEYTLAYKLTKWLTADLQAAYTHARFLTDDPAAPGRYIPGAVEGVVSAGLTLDNGLGWFGGVRWRYFGPRPLIEDNSVRSKATAPLSARIGYRFDDGLSVRLDGFNLLNEKASQIDYFYASRLPGEPAEGINDVHLHPIEPLSVRLTLTKQF